jgi:lysyl endopeptidase
LLYSRDFLKFDMRHLSFATTIIQKKIMIKHLFIVLITFLSLVTFGQVQGDGGTLPSKRFAISATLTHVDFQQPDIKKLRAEDAINDKTGDKAWRFGVMNDTYLSLENAGTWVHLPNGGRLWMLEVNCFFAQTINFSLRNTVIPNGNELYFSSSDQTIVLGKFTEKHLYKGNLGTELIKGNKARVEYYVAPENLNSIGSVEIFGVTHGYRSQSEFDDVIKSFGQSQACHKNVNCPEAADYTKQKRSVVFIVSSGTDLCTGTLINNTSYDGKPYILTANHCYGGNIPNWVFRFNYESPDCSNPPSIPAFQSISGAELRARRQGSDFLLVEITGGLEAGTVPAAFNAYFSGWDRSGEPLDKAVGIHHPRGDIKKISFEDDPVNAAQSQIGSVMSDPFGVWKVQWNRSTATEGGSSGSALFDQHKRLVGQLWGGQSSCSNLQGPDYYGRFATSWEPAGSNSTNQLKYWLDPSNTGAIAMDGFDLGSRLQVDAAIAHPKNTRGTICLPTIQPKIHLINMGQVAMTSATIAYGFDGVEQGVYSWSGNLSSLQFEEISLSQIQSTAGSHTFYAEVKTVNGQQDESTENDFISTSYYVMSQAQNFHLALNLDDYGSETSWELKSTANGTVFFNSPVYVDTPGGELRESDFCLEEGCYTFTIKDAYGDGMVYGSTGSFTIKDSQGTIVAQMTADDASFTTSYSVQFCVDGLSLNTIDAAVSLFPNPSSGVIYWSKSGVKEVRLMDLSGKVILEQKGDANQFSIEEAQSGVYIVQFDWLDGSSSQKKIILMK